MGTLLKLVTKRKTQEHSYDLSGDIIHKFSEEQMNKSAFAPRVNAHMVRNIVKNSLRLRNISSLLHAGSLVKF